MSIRSLRFWSIGLNRKRMVRQKAFVLRPVDNRQVSHSVIETVRLFRLDKRRPGERWQGAPLALRGPTRHKQLRHHRFKRSRPVDFRQVSETYVSHKLRLQLRRWCKTRDLLVFSRSRQLGDRDSQATPTTTPRSQTAWRKTKALWTQRLGSESSQCRALNQSHERAR